MILKDSSKRTVFIGIRDDDENNIFGTKTFRKAYQMGFSKART